MRKEKRVKSEKATLGTKEWRLTGPGTRDIPFEISDDRRADLTRGESQEERETNLMEIPAAQDDDRDIESSQQSGSSEHDLFVADEAQLEDARTRKEFRSRRGRRAPPVIDDIVEDDKMKMALNTTYDGFSIYGRILCLVVRRRKVKESKELAGGAGQAMMEEWIASSQMGEGPMMDD